MLKVIPIYAQAGINGFESPAAEYVQLGLSLDELLVENPSATFVGIASGESMTDYGIHSGDVLVVDRAAERSSFDVVVANLNGVFVCKAVDRKQKRLLSGAPGYESYALREGDVFQEEGIVVRSIRMFRQSHLINQCLR